MAVFTDLPTEVLLKIFQYYLQTETQNSFLSNIGKVCRAWNVICLDSSLWTKYDGTPSFKTMMHLSKEGALRNTKELIISFVKSFSVAQQTELFKSVPNVEAISFKNAKEISDGTLSIVAQNCRKLKEIKIGKKKNFILQYEILIEFLTLRGHKFTSIDFSFCKMPTMSTSIRCIADCCPNLESLHLTHSMSCCKITNFPTKYVQRHCTKLKSLYLDHKLNIDLSRHPSGFPDLEEFYYYNDSGPFFNDSETHFRDQQFEYVLFNSAKLKFLHLTNCQISASVMLSLPACSVESLLIPKCKAYSDDDLSDLLKKWSPSLKNLDLSNTHVKHAVSKLIETPAESPIEYLNLSYTLVQLDAVEKIIKNCSYLKTLVLEGCRNLQRGMKRTYSSKHEFEELTEKINSFRSTDTPEEHPVGD